MKDQMEECGNGIEIRGRYMNWDGESIRKASILLSDKVKTEISELKEFAEKEDLDEKWVLEMFAHKFTCRVNEMISV